MTHPDRVVFCGVRVAPFRHEPGAKGDSPRRIPQRHCCSIYYAKQSTTYTRLSAVPGAVNMTLLSTHFFCLCLGPVDALLVSRSPQAFVSKYSGAAEAAEAAGGTVAPAKKKPSETKKGKGGASGSAGKKAKTLGGKKS